MMLQVGVQRACHRMALQRADEDLTHAARAAEDDLTQAQADEQPQGPAQRSQQRRRIALSEAAGRRDCLDDTSGGVRNQDAARGVDGLQDHHGEIPPAVFADEIADEPEGARRQGRCIRGALECGGRVHWREPKDTGKRGPRRTERPPRSRIGRNATVTLRVAHQEIDGQRDGGACGDVPVKPPLMPGIFRP